MCLVVPSMKECCPDSEQCINLIKHWQLMRAWRGNLIFRVYSPDKPIKYGLKAYMLCDAENAFCLKFKLYTGRSIIQPSKNGATYDLERIFFETISKQDTHFSVIIIIVLHICSWTYGSEVQVPQVQCALTEKVFQRNLKRYL